MFGKHFASMYSGSMFGKPATVFAVWGYAIAHMRPSRSDGACYVELNPVLLGATFASSADSILDAINDLCSPDERSRSEIEGGRRLIPLGDTAKGGSLGPAQYRVVNGPKYRAMRDEEERRIYLRDAKRKERVNKVVDSQPASTKVSRGKPPSTQAEAEAEADTNNKRKNDLVELRSTETVSADVQVFNYWRERTGHEKAQWTKERQRLIRKRLQEENPNNPQMAAHGLKLAVDGAVRDPWFNGSENGRSYLDFDNIFRNRGRERIEKLQRLARAPERTRANTVAGRIDAAAEQALKSIARKKLAQ